MNPQQNEPPIQMDRATLGSALRNGPLSIPNYQREYSWTPKRVRKLFDDFNNAMVKKQSSYFLGTVVLTSGHPPGVVDGQQRLATTVIFLAAARDAFLALGLDADKQPKSIEEDFLFKFDRSIGELVPRLNMNTDDREYMRASVLERPEQRPSRVDSRLHSHRKIKDAAKIAAERVRHILGGADTVTRKVDALNAWIDFIDHNALIVMLTAPTAARAFQMFKTLNDRAQRTTQGDMIKNHLFEQADAADEAQAKWSTMRSMIEGIEQTQGEDPLLTYLHHFSIMSSGPTRKDDIFEVLEDRITGRKEALRFLESLALHASDYAAILTPSHAKWGSGYDVRVRKFVTQISGKVKMPFVRPLMLAIASRFTPAETTRAFRVLSSWVVRFLIAGGSRSGAVEQAVGTSAHLITNGVITTAQQLVDTMSHVVPGDVKFSQAFSTKTIANARQARFILRQCLQIA